MVNGAIVASNDTRPLVQTMILATSWRTQMNRTDRARAIDRLMRNLTGLNSIITSPLRVIKKISGSIMFACLFIGSRQSCSDSSTNPEPACIIPNHRERANSSLNIEQTTLIGNSQLATTLVALRWTDNQTHNKERTRREHGGKRNGFRVIISLRLLPVCLAVCVGHVRCCWLTCVQACLAMDN